MVIKIKRLNLIEPIRHHGFPNPNICSNLADFINREYINNNSSADQIVRKQQLDIIRRFISKFKNHYQDNSKNLQFTLLKKKEWHQNKITFSLDNRTLTDSTGRVPQSFDSLSDRSER